MVQRVLCASNNRKKVEELTAILLRLGDITVTNPASLGLALEVEETGSTFAENARLKAEAFQRASGLVTVADDSGLVVDALWGAPGIYSARFGGPGLTDQERYELVLERLTGVPDDLRTARFVCAIAVAHGAKETVIFESRVEGRITHRPAGAAGFGYDPIFYFPPFERTFAEVTPGLKASVSHRGQALRQAAPYLLELLRNDILDER